MFYVTKVLYTYTQVHTHIQMYTHTHTNKHPHTHTHTYIYIYIYIYMFIYIYIYKADVIGILDMCRPESGETKNISIGSRQVVIIVDLVVV